MEKNILVKFEKGERSKIRNCGHCIENCLYKVRLSERPVTGNTK